MIIGFLGKGGSGKSTLSALFAQYLSRRGSDTLAIDADYNMDLAFNLGIVDLPTLKKIGTGMPDIRTHIGVTEREHFRTVFSRTPLPRFTVSPKDTFTSKYTLQISDKLHLMVAGEHTDNVLYGTHCSHSLFTPLKIYLPLLTLTENQYVVVDETAGTDAVGTGIVTGFDLACVCVEPHPQSIKAALQIAHMLEFYQTPYVFLGNKINNESGRALLESQLSKKPLMYIGDIQKDHSAEFEKIRLHAHQASRSNSDRLKRTQEKFARSAEFEMTHTH